MRKLCKCGCRKPTIWNRNYKDYNTYITRHQNIGIKFSDEHKRNMSLAKQNITEETRLKMSISQTGRKHSKETKQKMSLAKQNMSEETKLNMSLAKQNMSEETKQKISKARIGMKFSDEHKRNMSKSQKGLLIGKKNGRWLGGKSFEPYGFDFNNELKNLVRKRDNNKCQLCMKRKYKRKHQVHHIDYDKENNNPDNLITLCLPCHGKTNHNGRNKWTRLFRK